jgi:hypothetical protein
MGQCIEAFDFFLYQPTVGQRKDIEHANSSKPRKQFAAGWGCLSGNQPVKSQKLSHWVLPQQGSRS